MYVIAQPRRILRLEGASLFTAAVLGVVTLRGGWWLALGALVLPDTAIVLYALGDRRGALAYNLAHSWVTPGVLLLLGVLSHQRGLDAFALGWIAHVGLDRALGYGLKYETGFAHTHLGRINSPSTHSTTPAVSREPPQR